MSAREHRVAEPAGGDECGENNYRAGDEQDITPCSRLRGKRRLSGRHPGTLILWCGNGPLAGRAVDLRSGIAGVALDLPAASRAEEIEFRHEFCWL